MISNSGLIPTVVVSGFETHGFP